MNVNALDRTVSETIFCCRKITLPALAVIHIKVIKSRRYEWA
jgi:hypothetical protein